jgi:hypothetical protein
VLGGVDKSGRFKWLLDSPLPRYDIFYAYKKQAIDRCCVYGELKFANLRKDIRQAVVDVSNVTFDPREIHIKMQTVQDWRNRVKQIQIEVSTQYFLWKRAIPLLRGFLARVETSKPLIRQEGLVMEHMGDIELYFGELEGLHESIERIDTNLNSACECLSRQITIAMPMKSIERYERQEQKPVQETVQQPIPNSALDFFDALPKDASDKNGLKQMSSDGMPKGIKMVL